MYSNLISCIVILKYILFVFTQLKEKLKQISPWKPIENKRKMGNAAAMAIANLVEELDQDAERELERDDRYLREQIAFLERLDRQRLLQIGALENELSTTAHWRHHHPE